VKSVPAKNLCHLVRQNSGGCVSEFFAARATIFDASPGKNPCSGSGSDFFTSETDEVEIGTFAEALRADTDIVRACATQLRQEKSWGTDNDRTLF